MPATAQGPGRVGASASAAAPRTLIVSDLHLGIRRGHDVLRRPAALERLVQALGDAERLILLGDVVELTEGAPRRALAAAAPVLRAIAAAMKGREVVLVPGNHDAPFARQWVRTHARRLGTETLVPPTASPYLRELGELMQGCRLTVSYPGYRAAPEVWVAHGHQLNRHLLPSSTVGVPRAWLGKPSRALGPGDYERPRAGAAPRALGWPFMLLRRLADPQLAPLTSRLIGLQLERAALPAMRRVLDGFGVQARHVVFGHVHRLGPLPDDPSEPWSARGGRPALLNTGSWLFEPLLVRHADGSHPYWPGGAVLLEPGGAPRTVALLADLPARELAGRSR